MRPWIVNARVLPLLLALLCAHVGCEAGETAGAARPRPNLLLVSIDTLRADHLGAYGYPRDTSPNLDRLAREGVLFRQAMAPSSWTLPSHASMLTGLEPSRHGAVFWKPWSRVADEVETLAERLRDAGYATAAVVDGGWVGEQRGFAQGFDEFVDWRDRLALVGRVEQSARVARDFALGHGEVPFFLFLHTYQVHLPFAPPPELAGHFDPGYVGPYASSFQPADARAVKQGRPLEGAALAHVVALYDAEIRHTDAVLGELFDFLRRSGLAERTCTIVTSDHGEEFLEHGDLLHEQAKLYEELVWVPLILWCPGRLPAGLVVEEPVSLVDVTPTLLELAGLPAAPDLDGRSLVPLLDPDRPPPPRLLVSEADWTVRGLGVPPGSGTTLALRAGPWKLIHHSGDGREELFDLEGDPGESRDLRDERPDVAARFHPRLAELLARRPEPPVVREREAFDPAEAEQLKALGYLD